DCESGRSSRRWAGRPGTTIHVDGPEHILYMQCPRGRPDHSLGALGSDDSSARRGPGMVLLFALVRAPRVARFDNGLAGTFDAFLSGSFRECRRWRFSRASINVRASTFTTMDWSVGPAFFWPR